MELSKVLYTESDGIARIALNEPSKLNALSVETWRDLDYAFTKAIQSDAVKVIILAGEGRSFCSGFDMSQSREQHKRELYDQWEELNLQRETMVKIWNSPKIVICAIQGYCLGGGFELANCADLIVASDDARFGEIELRYSIAPQPALLYIVGIRKAKEILLLTDYFDADEALRIGFVNRIVPRSELNEMCMNMAQRLARMPQETVRLTKRLMNKALDLQGFEIMGDWGWDTFLLTKNMNTELMKKFDEVCEKDGLKAGYKFMQTYFE